MNRTKFASIAVPCGLLLILAATMAPFFLSWAEWAQEAYKYVYAAGALVVLAARILQPKVSPDLRLRRLRHMEVWIGIIFCVAAFFLFYPGALLRDWLAFTLAGAALQAYTSIAIPAREKRIKN